MNPEIREMARFIIGLYETQRARLEDKSKGELSDLKHSCEEHSHNPDFSVRTSAEINRTACVMILESRK